MAKNAKRNPADAFFAGLTDSFTKTPEQEKVETPKVADVQPQVNEDQPQVKEAQLEPVKTEVEMSFSRDDREVKSKRVNLILQPSLYAKAQKVAKKHGISFNEMITQMLRHITEGQ